MKRRAIKTAIKPSVVNAHPVVDKKGFIESVIKECFVELVGKVAAFARI